MTWASWIILCAITFALWFEFTGRRLGIAAIPMTPWQRRRVVDAVRQYAPTRGNLNIIELGSGWGGVVAALDKVCNPRKGGDPAKIIGYELFCPAYWFSRVRFMCCKNIHIKHANFFTADLSNADVVVCYLSHNLMAKLGPKFKSELKPGAIIVSNAFPIPDWQPIAHNKTPGTIEFQVFVYRV